MHVYDDHVAKTAALLKQHDWIACARIETRDGTMVEETDRSRMVERVRTLEQQ